MPRCIKNIIGAVKRYHERYGFWPVRYLNRRLCGILGHDYEDFADGENGRGTLECKRCGENHPYQW